MNSMGSIAKRCDLMAMRDSFANVTVTTDYSKSGMESQLDHWSIEMKLRFHCALFDWKNDVKQ